LVVVRRWRRDIFFLAELLFVFVIIIVIVIIAIVVVVAPVIITSVVVVVAPHRSAASSPTPTSSPPTILIVFVSVAHVDWPRAQIIDAPCSRPIMTRCAAVNIREETLVRFVETARHHFCPNSCVFRAQESLVGMSSDVTKWMRRQFLIRAAVGAHETHSRACGQCPQ
jgi:hypothetical protein